MTVDTKELMRLHADCEDNPSAFRRAAHEVFPELVKELEALREVIQSRAIARAERDALKAALLHDAQLTKSQGDAVAALETERDALKAELDYCRQGYEHRVRALKAKHERLSNAARDVCDDDEGADLSGDVIDALRSTLASIDSPDKASVSEASMSPDPAVDDAKLADSGVTAGCDDDATILNAEREHCVHTAHANTTPFSGHGWNPRVCYERHLVPLLMSERAAARQEGAALSAEFLAAVEALVGFIQPTGIQAFKAVDASNRVRELLAKVRL